jgi:hypothetical protein
MDSWKSKVVQICETKLAVNGQDTASRQPFVLSHSPRTQTETPENSRSHSRVEVFRKQLEIGKQINQEKSREKVRWRFNSIE